jgi:hypothetical protein
MEQVFPVTVTLMVATVITLSLQNFFASRDRIHIWGCWAFHIVSAFVLLYLMEHVYGRSDLHVYYEQGSMLAEHLLMDFRGYGPELLKLIFQFEAYIPIRIFGHPGTSTTTMIGITGALMWLTNHSWHAAGLIFSFIAFTGQIAMYATMEKYFPSAYRKRLIIACLYLPSVVFWSSGIVKEALAIGGLGWMMLGFTFFIKGKGRLIGLSLLFAGGVVVAISKAYVLLPFSVGAGAWYYWDRSLKSTGSVGLLNRPFQMIGAALLGLGGMIALGQMFPEYSVDNFAEEASRLQQASAYNSGASNYQIADGQADSLTAQLMFAPMAMIAALFRPFIFEAHNPLALINGLETFLATILVIMVLRARGLKESARLLVSSPILVFCLIFVILFGLGVGLTTTNLGTLSRYRIPMMPMYIGMLLMLLPLKQSALDKARRARG